MTVKQRSSVGRTSLSPGYSAWTWTQTLDLLALPNCLLAVFSSQHLALDQAWLQNKGCANVGDKCLLSARHTFSPLGVFDRLYSKVKFMLNHCFMLYFKRLEQE